MKIGIPNKHGEHYYFGYNSGVMAQTAWYRIKSKGTYKIDGKSPLNNSELFMDPNQLSSDGKVELGSTYWSPNGKFMAYTISQGGSDWKRVYVKNISSGIDIPGDELNWIKFSGISWTNDNKGFFYSRYDIPGSYSNTNMNDSQQVLNKQGTETDKLTNMKLFYHRIGEK